MTAPLNHDHEYTALCAKQIVGSKASHREADYRFLRKSSPSSWQARAEPLRGWVYDLATLACLLAVGAMLAFLAAVFS